MNSLIQKSLILKSETSTGIPLRAEFLPEMGMNMISFKRGEVEVIDQSTRAQFEERYAGLGSLIGPHFHRKRQLTPLSGEDQSKIPHIANLKGAQRTDPFSHGIGRYAAWRWEADENSLSATLTGKDTLNGLPLSLLEGQDFTMNFKAKLGAQGLNIEMSIVSETASLVGIHYYYHLPNGKGKIVSQVKEEYLSSPASNPLPIPPDWDYDSTKTLKFDLRNEADYTFHPFPDPLQGKIILETDSYRLVTSYSSLSEENSWQLYHPAGASFVCIEPVSSMDPRHPNLTVSSININLNIFDGTDG